MLIAGNWKMYTDLASATSLAEDVARSVESLNDGLHVAVCPPFISLDAVSVTLRGTRVRLGAQNMHHETEGAFTGEVSAEMLRSVGCTYVILGHSERRQYFGETDDGVNRKVRAAMKAGLIPIVCIGETLDERREGREQDVVRRQTKNALDGIAISSASEIVLAYEPVWAIGTGETATPDQAQAMHRFIRSLVQESLAGVRAEEVHILYGGSMKPANASELLAQPDVDGGLIGGASLKAADFQAIIDAARTATG
jgi:triosephosphate isomerase (TIM)